MMDITLTAMGLEIATPDDEALTNGADPEVVVRVTSALMVPVVDPQTQRPIGMMPVPNGRYSFTIGDPEEAERFFEHGLERARELPRRRKSDIAIASGMGDVERAASALRVPGA